MISELKWTKKARMAVVILCVVLATAGLAIFSQMNQVAEAAILTPIDSLPETLFYDDFSSDLSQWTIIGGTWNIENNELLGNSSTAENVIVAGDTDWTNYVLEAKIKVVMGEASFFVRADVNAQNGYLMSFTSFTADRIYKVVDGGYSSVATGLPALTSGRWYDVQIVASENTIKVYRDGMLSVSYTDSTPFSSGRIGCRVYAGREGHYDDVEVTTTGGVVSAYNISVNPRRSKMVITCVWNGPENLTVANLTTPTAIYYESDMSVYERTTFSTESGNSGILNVRRAELSFSAVTSPEIWELYLDLNEVTLYTVSVEIS